MAAPAPAAPPEGYIGWPLWYHRVCLVHNRAFGWLFLLGAIAASFTAQSRAAAAIDALAADDGRGPIRSGASGVLALWLMIVGLILVGKSVGLQTPRTPLDRYADRQPTSRQGTPRRTTSYTLEADRPAPKRPVDDFGEVPF